MIGTPSTDACCDAPSRTVHVITHGCQMNVHDSRRIVQVLARLGYRETPDPAGADLILINTCSVRARPENKVLGTLARLRPLKESRPGMKIAVCGCVAQQHGRELLDRVPWLDLVFGPDRIPDLPGMIRDLDEGSRVAVTGQDDPEDYRFLPVDPSSEPGPTAFVTVTKGCNRFCSYCIVPFVRGREASKPPDMLVREIRGLVSAGVREVTLLGQNVNAWGRGLPGEPRFADLLETVAAIPGLRRIRFVTSHPADAEDRLLDLFGSLPNLAPYLHLPVQAGSDAVLQRMHRGYTAAHYLGRLERVRRACPDIALSTDVIVGFPGETREDFQATLALVREARFDGMFSFAYSPRPGTAAARWPDDVPAGEKAARLAELQALQDGITASRMERYRGRELDVLVEGPSRDATRSREGAGDRRGEVQGRSGTNVPVHFRSDLPPERARGRMARVLVDEILAHSLRGTLARWEES